MRGREREKGERGSKGKGKREKGIGKREKGKGKTLKREARG